VVVVVHDDADRLPRAVRSVLDQSMRGVEAVIVDDASTDRTEAVATRLARDPRVRYLRLADNSGAAGRPRNIGIEAATGDYLMFLDSDDELDRHACRALLAAAEDSGSEVVAGRWVRVEGPDREADPWYVDLFDRTATWPAVDEQPDLLYDTIATNKLYRRSLLERTGLRFPEGNVLGDLGFVTEALVAASGITVVPQCTYRWYAPAEHTAVMTPEADARATRDRLAVHRDLDTFLAEHASPALRLRKDVKFLRVDLPLYLKAATRHEPRLAAELLPPLRDYLATLDPRAHDGLDPMLAIAAFMVRHDDVAGARSVIDYLEHDRKVTTRLVQRDGRVYWVDRYLDTDEGRRVLDVTTVGFQELQLSALHLDTRIDALDVRGDRVHLRGHTLNQLGRVPPGRVSKLALSVAPSGTSRRTAVPVTMVEHTSERLVWECTVDLAKVVRPTWRGYRRWTLRLTMTVAGETTRVPLSAFGDAALQGRRLMSRVRWYPIGNVLRTEVTARGNLGLCLSPEGRLATLVAWLGALVLSAPVARTARDAYVEVRRALRRLVNSGDTKSRVYRGLFVRLPLKQRSVLFENHMGQSYSDNPRYVFEELHRRNAGFDIVWSFAGDNPPAMPAGVRTVRRNSWSYFLALARSRYWVDNQGLPGTLTKPARTTYVQTWHGSALKRMGEDTPGFRSLPEDRRARHRAMVARWDYFLARSEHDVRTLVPALSVRGEVLRSGYPRNDPLVQLRSPEQRAAVRRELGLPADAVLVLYAPTFRETYAEGRQDFALQVDLDQMHEKLPGHLLLVRTHYLQRLQLPAAAHTVARDVSHLPDITPLMVAADVLVTDYSSVMFDFANTGRPMVFFAYDYDDYVHSERGVYFELADKAPGPLVRTGDELIQALASVDTWRADYAERYAAFIREFGEYDRGTAAQQVVDRVFFGSADG
jgi:CDP-glycerol glycerophosphotransferase